MDAGSGPELRALQALGLQAAALAASGVGCIRVNIAEAHFGRRLGEDVSFHCELLPVV